MTGPGQGELGPPGAPVGTIRVGLIGFGLAARTFHLPLLRATPADAFARTLNHPENGPMTMDALLGVYAWHGRHHTAHVSALRERMKWE